MGNCWSLPSDSPAAHPNSNTGANNQLGSSRFLAGVSNSRLLQSSNSTSLERSYHSGGISQLFGPSSSNNYTSSNNTSASFWSSENTQTSRAARHEQKCPCRLILDAANLRVFTLAEMREATRNFRADLLLGEGGFGKVHKGWLKERAASKRDEGLTVAIKRLSPDSSQGFKEWQAEVNFLGRLSHPNLVELLGFGQEDSELFLVYEFMPRGTLDNQLFGRGANIRPLSWDTRLKIMIGAARGLDFLHSLEKNIIYRDFKPSNVLLDKTYTAKLADLGLAKSGPSADQTYVSTRVVGTVGYAAPEYLATGHLYVKSDVYGFGIVLVEMLTGKRISDITHLRQSKSLHEWLKSNLLSRGKMINTMDARLEGKYPSKLAFRVAQLALKCIGTDPKIRPSTKEVVETLEQIEAAKEKPAGNRKRATLSRPAQQHGRPDAG